MSHQNSYDLESRRTLASYDINHRFVISYLYELPFGRDRKFFAGVSPLVNAFIKRQRSALERAGRGAAGAQFGLKALWWMG